MKEINVEQNKTGLKVFVNGAPDIQAIPKEMGAAYVGELEKHVVKTREKSTLSSINLSHLS